MVKPKYTPTDPANLEWMDAAACLGAPLAIFFPSKEGGAPIHAIREARALCATCPVIAACLAWGHVSDAMAGARYGLFGGQTPYQRARPAADEAAA